MKPFSFEDFFSAPREPISSGAQLYILRSLRQLAAGGSGGISPPSYGEVKRLASRLGLHNISRLQALFKDLDLGDIEAAISNDQIRVLFSSNPGVLASETKWGRELEKGLIDGALELITGIPVTTSSTGCVARGDHICKFEAMLNEDGAAPRFVAAETVEARSSIEAAPDTDAFSGRRSWYMDLAGRELARAKRRQRSLAMLYIDLDDLGEINQRLGRQAGDDAIGAVAAVLSKSCRMEDTIWHNGEDEFAVVLSETDSAGAAAVAERLIRLISSGGYYPHRARMSVSIGCAIFLRDSEDIHGLLAGARSALYLAKANGKGKWREAKSGASNQSQSEKEKSGRRGRETSQEMEVQEAEERESSEQTLPEAENERLSGIDELLSGASVMIASVSPLIITGMRQAISGARATRTDGLIAAEVTDPENLSGAVADMRPDLVFVDMQMAAFGEFALLKLVREENLPCKIVALAGEVGADVVKLVADFSIDGVIMQTTPVDETLSLLDKIYQGNSFLPDEVKAALNELEGSRRFLNDLSDRELEVLRLVAEGKSNSQISEKLFVTINTVRFHLANVYQKLGVSNRTEAANHYLRQEPGFNR